MERVGVIEFKYLRNADEMHFRVIEGDAHPSAAQTSAAREIMKSRGIGKTRFEIFNDGKTVKEL